MSRRPLPPQPPGPHSRSSPARREGTLTRDRRDAHPAPKAYKAISAYYDAEYDHLPYLKTDVPFLLSRMPRRRQRVLELAVGTGRAAIPLAEAGHRVVGVDSDRDMLAHAARKRDFAGLRPKRLELVEGDIQTYRHPGGAGHFDWVVLLFNTLLAFPTLGQLDAVLTTAAHHLRPGGSLWVDVFNPDVKQLGEDHLAGLDPVTFYVPELDRTVSRTAEVFDVGPKAFQRRRVVFHYRWFERGMQRHRALSFDMTWLMPRELQLLLERNGFRVREMWGNHEGLPVGEDSPRVVVHARRMSKA